MISEMRAGDGTARAGRSDAAEAEAIEDAWGGIDAADLPSFRPLNARAHRAPPRSSPPRPPPTETHHADAALPFSRARALASAAPPLPADRHTDLAWRAWPARPAAARPWRYGLLLCIFLAGAAAGIGGRYLAAVPGIDGVLAQARAQMRAALALLPQGAPRHGSAVSEKLPAPPAPPSITRDRTTASAITAEPGETPAAAAEASPAPTTTEAAPATVAAAEPPPAPAPASAPAAATRPPAALAAFALLRGDEAMKQRDVIAARRLYEFAASAGVSGAAAAVARSYDPLYLQQQGIRGVPADVATALRWYRRARDDASETPARAR
jgi:hypothetical protein